VYFHEVVDSILLRDVWLTLIKSVIFATIIVPVVKSAFVVILADLVATALFYVMGWSAAGCHRSPCGRRAL
jgi:ABC-type transporter Mla maintaining outer membrane lipid asymmetry permease subunit MlaE